MNYNGTPRHELQGRLDNALDGLAITFLATGTEQAAGPLQASVNGVLSMVVMARNALTEPDIDIAYGMFRSIDQVLSDAIEGRPVDARTDTYKAALAAIQGK